MKNLFQASALIFALVGCASNNTRYIWEKTFESGVGYAQADAQCQYEYQLQRNAEQRSGYQRGAIQIWQELSSMTNPTILSCMNRFGYVPREFQISPAKSLLKDGRQLFERKDYEAAFVKFHEAAKLGSSDAQVILGSMYEEGLGVASSKKNAIEWYERSANQGDADAAFNLAGLYVEQGSDYKEAAIKWYEYAASKKNVGAMYNLGLIYDYGKIGVTTSKSKAANLYKEASESGHVKAMNRLGTMYQKGEGIQSNSLEALRLYKQAALNGNQEAQLNYGAMLFVGEDISKDRQSGFLWTLIAAKNGFATAKKNLEVMEKDLTAEERENAKQKSEKCFNDLKSCL